jgi:hypothetical protein
MATYNSQAAHAALVQQPGYQFTFPKFVPPQPPVWLLAVGHFLAHYWPTIKWGIWIVAGLTLLMLAYVTVRRHWPRIVAAVKGPSKSEPASLVADWHPTAAAARQLLHESDALAQDGRYGDAVHLILLRSIEDITAQRPLLLRPHFTSREIGALEALPHSVRDSFRKIARLVERAIFAGQPVSAGEFQTCRADYQRFALDHSGHPSGGAA